jgi:hypothetical protein
VEEVAEAGAAPGGEEGRHLTGLAVTGTSPAWPRSVVGVAARILGLIDLLVGRAPTSASIAQALLSAAKAHFQWYTNTRTFRKNNRRLDVRRMAILRTFRDLLGSGKDVQRDDERPDCVGDTPCNQ